MGTEAALPASSGVSHYVAGLTTSVLANLSSSKMWQHIIVALSVASIVVS